jgi:hypothetical protein
MPVLRRVLALADDGRLETWEGWAFRGAALALVGALAVWALEKAGLRASGARCRDCRKRIAYGHMYCMDHLQARRMAAQERYHGVRGIGV